ncbi:hypothetical protein [Streptomyces sp. NBC_00525]|uniref:hypothetical protein n=1 Tax=Streptomyces sp. NBC_00525 TaxID=2903660 RepID=UPI002E8164BC|nr:hypothetical protein [Streptomyces sp. NBC_00525]WUC95091.1 hypothetical protein OG710_16535 [Streptomyces sp. NBC_00525]
MSDGPGTGSSFDGKNYGDGGTIISRVGTMVQIFFQRMPSVAGWLFLVLATVFAGYAAWNWPGGPRKQYTAFFVFLILAFLTAVIHIGTSRPQGRGFRYRARTWLLIASLVLSLVSWWSFQNVVRNGEVPATIRVTGEQPLTGEPGSALTLTLPQPDHADRRDRLRLTLEIGEDDPDAPACSHKTHVLLTAVTQGVTPRRSRLPARSTTDFALGDLADRSGTSFELQVRTVEGCTLRLVDWRAVLHND